MFKAITVDELLNEATTLGPDFEFEQDRKWTVIGNHIISEDQYQYGSKVADLAMNIAEELLDKVNIFFEDNPDSNLEQFTDDGLHDEVIGSWVDNACIYTADTANLLADSPSLGLLEDYREQFGDSVENATDIYKLITMELYCWMTQAAYRALGLIQMVLDKREELEKVS